MCEPVTIITAITTATTAIGAAGASAAAAMGITSSGVAALGAGVSALGARQNAKTQGKNMSEAQRVKNKQITDANSAKAGERTKQAWAEKARLRVAAGESGVTGQSFEAQLADVNFQLGQDIAMIEHNTATAGEASNVQTATAFSNVKNPSLLESGLQIAGAAKFGASVTEKATTIEES